MARTLPFGSWPSPITAADVARGGIRLGGAAVGTDSHGALEFWWSESRPTEGGRTVVVRRDRDGATADAYGQGWNARSRVHEYGGTCWSPVGGGDLVFAHWDDQRLYRVTPGGEPRALTPPPAVEMGDRYADLVAAPDGAEVLCVRERAVEGAAGTAVERAIVAVPLDGSAAGEPDALRVVAAGSHFLAYPRISPDGRRLAWIAWEHPQMPWDGTELRVATLSGGVAEAPKTLLGGPDESVLQPEWTPEGDLLAVSDRSGWWNLYRVPLADGEPAALYPSDSEFAEPLWQLGFRTFARLEDGRLVVTYGTDDRRLGLLDPTAGTLHEVELPYPVVRPTLSVSGHTLVTVAQAPDRPGAVLTVDLSSGAWSVLRAEADATPDPAYLPTPEALTLPAADGREVHALVYPPTSPVALGPAGEQPPYVVFVHGGPTAQAFATLDLTKAYFTSRGIGVIDVNYGGSTGYGRAYRNRLRGAWGVVDVADSVAAVTALAASGRADAARLAIRGGSAGGWTTLAALVGTDTFAAGVSYFGVAELVHFVADTHDFESRYIDGLIGPLPEAHALYDERAPLSHVDSLSCPVLLLQGLDDKIVPPSQSEMFRDALARKGIPHAYRAYAGEQHGFRKAETIIDALESELSFYGQVFGFEPPGVPVLPLTRGS